MTERQEELLAECLWFAAYHVGDLNLPADGEAWGSEEIEELERLLLGAREVAQ